MIPRLFPDMIIVRAKLFTQVPLSPFFLSCQ